MGLPMQRYSALGRFVKVTPVFKVFFLSCTTSNLKCCRLSVPLTSERPTNRLGSELPARTAMGKQFHLLVLGCLLYSALTTQGEVLGIVYTSACLRS